MKALIEGHPPSVNHYKQRGKYGNYYRTKEADLWLTAAIFAIKARKKTPFKGRVEVYITINYWSLATLNRDADNFQKLILDALKYSGLIKDDCLKYVPYVHVMLGEKVEKHKETIELEVTEIGV